MRIIPNPYHWDRVNLKLFYGRQTLSTNIINELLENHSCAIVGGRKMGKTTLLRKIQKDLEVANSSSLAGGLLMLPIYIHTLGLPQPLESRIIYVDIVRQLDKSLKKLNLLNTSRQPAEIVFKEFPGEENRAFTTILSDFIASVEAKCFLQVVILIDEIEPIAKMEWAEGFFSNWRHILSNEPELSSHVSAIFSGAKEMIAIAQDVGSPLANILNWHELSLFSRRDSEELINEPTNQSLSSNFTSKVFNWTGGHPFLIQYLMQYVCGFEIEEAAIRLKEARRRFFSNQSGQFYNWWFDKLSENDRKVYIHLVNVNHTVPKRDIIKLVGDIPANQALSVLCHTGVVRKRSKSEEYKVAGSMFKDWVKRNGGSSNGPSTYDNTIYISLNQLDPEIGRKYISAWSIHNVELPNYSGAVSELRDVLTLTLHKLAPDLEVVTQPRYTPELDEKGKPLPKPTRSQRVEFIMRNKGIRDSKGINAEINLLETLIEQLSRVVSGGYGHASARTHTVATQEQAWKCLKQLDSILAQII